MVCGRYYYCYYYVYIVCMEVLPNYVITSKNVKKMKELFPYAKEELLIILQTKVLNFEYVSACVREKCLIDTYQYRIIMNDTFNKKPCKYSQNVLDINNDSDSDDNDIKSSYIPYTIPSFSQNVNYSSNDIANSILTSLQSNEELFKEIQNSIKTSSSLNKENICESNTNSNIINSTQLSPKSCPKITSTQYTPYGNWAFLRTSPSKQPNLNEHITSHLEQIQSFHSNEGHIFESLAYRKAITLLKNHPIKITEISQLSSLKHIGSKISSKIKEILITGSSSTSTYVSHDSKNLSIQTLMQVHGIGIKQANEFYRKGITTISQLKQISHTLPLLIQKGLQYYDDIQKKIPREEISEIFTIIKEEVYTVLSEDVVDVEVCGSYRRGRMECGDIDVLITRKDDGGVEGVLEMVVERLMERKVIVDVLVMGTEGRNGFMGICIGKMGICRRLDMKVYVKEEFPFAVLYFTGSEYFNRSMRLYAKKKKMHLSDRELSYRTTGIKIKCKTERDIFTALGIEYKPPSERDI